VECVWFGMMWVEGSSCEVEQGRIKMVGCGMKFGVVRCEVWGASVVSVLTLKIL
jgi:hypothetical protein